MRSIYVSLALAFVTAAGCGDDGGKTTNPNVDAKPATDSGPDVDAPPVVTGDPMGRQCTPTGNTVEQADCPTGYVCLGLQGGTHPWCTKTCTPDAAGNMACATAYTGEKGLGAC